jgi:hypothetical protein
LSRAATIVLYVVVAVVLYFPINLITARCANRSAYPRARR